MKASLKRLCVFVMVVVGVACREPSEGAVGALIPADGGAPLPPVPVPHVFTRMYLVPIDRDADGSPLPYDCDDGNGRVVPGSLELCDGVDNDCNGLVDEDWPIGEPCELQNACRTPGWIECTDDARNARCKNEDAECAE